MSKKGNIIWDYLLKFLVGLVVLGVLFAVFFPGLFANTRQYITDILFAADVPFEPFEPTVTGEEQKVIDSLNALQTAINAVAEGADVSIYDKTKIIAIISALKRRPKRRYSLSLSYTLITMICSFN